MLARRAGAGLRFPEPHLTALSHNGSHRAAVADILPGEQRVEKGILCAENNGRTTSGLLFTSRMER